MKIKKVNVGLYFLKEGTDASLQNSKRKDASLFQTTSFKSAAYVHVMLFAAMQFIESRPQAQTQTPDVRSQPFLPIPPVHL